jgi:hypothetical protein
MAQKRKAKAGSARKVRMILVTGPDGAIAGGMFAQAARRGDVRISFRPLPGQAVHEVDVPAGLVTDKSAQELQAALSAYRVAPAQSRLVLRAATSSR